MTDSPTPSPPEAMPGEEARCDYNVEARRMKGCCLDCGRKYGDEYGFPDLLVPHDIWARISPTGDEGGLLCPSCMCRRAADIGLENVPAKFVSGPFRAALLPRCEARGETIERLAVVTNAIQNIYGELPRDRAPGPPDYIVKELRAIARALSPQHAAGGEAIGAALGIEKMVATVKALLADWDADWDADKIPEKIIHRYIWSLREADRALSPQSDNAAGGETIEKIIERAILFAKDDHGDVVNWTAGWWGKEKTLQFFARSIARALSPQSQGG